MLELNDETTSSPDTISPIYTKWFASSDIQLIFHKGTTLVMKQRKGWAGKVTLAIISDFMLKVMTIQIQWNCIKITFKET